MPQFDFSDFIRIFLLFLLFIIIIHIIVINYLLPISLKIMLFNRFKLNILESELLKLDVRYGRKKYFINKYFSNIAKLLIKVL